jgi:hypothetical protein
LQPWTASWWATTSPIRGLEAIPWHPHGVRAGPCAHRNPSGSIGHRQVWMEWAGRLARVIEPIMNDSDRRIAHH